MNKKLIEIIYDYKKIVDENIDCILIGDNKIYDFKDEIISVLYLKRHSYTIFQFKIDHFAFYFCINDKEIYQISLNKDIRGNNDPDYIFGEDIFEDLFSEKDHLLFLMKYDKSLLCEYDSTIVDKLTKCFDKIIKKLKT